MDDIAPAEKTKEYSQAKTYVVTEAETEADARRSAETQYRDEIEHQFLIKDLQAFVRTHPKGYEVAVVARLQ
jgi:hypothetical protein